MSNNEPSRWLIPLFAAVAMLGAACGHTHSVEPASKAEKTDKDAKAEKTDKAQKSEKSEKSDRPAREKSATTTALKGDEVPIARTPAGLLQPDATKKLQEKLAASGELDEGDVSGKLDEPTRRALRKFQDSKNLPATGVPDDETIRKLGLDPKQIFRSKADADADAARSK
jgi:peptidoglycan hydrolase-like protein with peptidoglycan-binding domain